MFLNEDRTRFIYGRLIELPPPCVQVPDVGRERPGVPGQAGHLPGVVLTYPHQKSLSCP